MTDLKPRRKATRSKPVRFALTLLILILASLALSPWIGRATCYVVNKQIAVWDAEREAFKQTLVSK